MATLQQLHRDDYLLDPRNEIDRLDLQAKVWEPAAEQMLGEIGVQSGWRAVDLGCGVRGMLEPLADAVDMIGTVIGVDRDPTLLAAARQWANEKSLHNVWLFQDDIFRTDLPRGIYDLVHARFVFAPIGRDDVLLREMIDLVRPGGVVAIQEPDSASWNFHPRRAGFDALKPTILRAFRAAGGDFDAGLRLFSMLRQAGLEDIQVRAHVRCCRPSMPIGGCRRSSLSRSASASSMAGCSAKINSTPPSPTAKPRPTMTTRCARLSRCSRRGDASLNEETIAIENFQFSVAN